MVARRGLAEREAVLVLPLGRRLVARRVRSRLGLVRRTFGMVVCCRRLDDGAGAAVSGAAGAVATGAAGAAAAALPDPP